MGCLQILSSFVGPSQAPNPLLSPNVIFWTPKTFVIVICHLFLEKSDTVCLSDSDMHTG